MSDEKNSGDPVEASGHAASEKSATGQPLLWYCPSRWLLAHHDLQANINTMSSHMCLADLNNDGENLLALIDFKQARHAKRSFSTGGDISIQPEPPYECRMRVYRGQQLIYNHFLEDMPSCLLASSISLPIVSQPRVKFGNSVVSMIDTLGGGASGLQQSSDGRMQQQPLLTMAINDDVYFYHKLKPSHKLSLEDEESVLDSLNKSEVEAWQMVRQNKVDNGTMRELLMSLSQELGDHELSSHSQNFIALNSEEDRKQYLIAWKLRRLQQSNNLSEQIMSMDTICCSAARLKYNSSITRSGDFGQTRGQGSVVNNNAIWNKILDIQKDGLLLGTEDRHLLIYELRSIRTRLECHYRLRATPDHILVERRPPASFNWRHDVRTFTYKILISCRDCRIYCIDQLYLVDQKSSPCPLKELVALKSNVLDISWTGSDDDAAEATSGGVERNTGAPYQPANFVVACLDRRVYCFGSQSGQCKWIIEQELPITCIVCLPKLHIGTDEASLIGVSSKANRIDFYVGATGRIVDSIYFSQEDYPQAMTFGRFGREDNCLCLVTSLGRLALLILKRTAKFAHGQCLSSAASYASYTMASCRQTLRESIGNSDKQAAMSGEAQNQTQERLQQQQQQQQLKVGQGMNLPSAFTLSKSNSNNITDKVIDSVLHSTHNCDQTSLKNALDVHAARPRLQIPVKSRNFVEQILEQNRSSRLMALKFAGQMVKLSDKIKSTFNSGASSTDDSSRVTLTRLIGLGNVYRINLALRMNLAKFVEQYQQLIPEPARNGETSSSQSSKWTLTCLLKPRKSSLCNRLSQVRPFKTQIPVGADRNSESHVKAICEATIEVRLTVLGPSIEPVDGESVPLDVHIMATHQCGTSRILIRRPFLVTTINVPLATG